MTWDTAKSCIRTFKEGLSQGSVLAPLLLTIYINDLLESIPQPIVASAFADDIAVAAQGQRNEDCCATLQPALDIISEWATGWKITISTARSCCTLFTLDLKETHDKVVPDLHLANARMPHTTTPKYLGATLDQQLIFTSHTKSVKSRLQARLKVLRALADRSWGRLHQALRSFYQGYAQPIATCLP